MSLEGYKPTTIERLGGLASAFASETLAAGVSPDLRNIRFGLSSLATRYGLQSTISCGRTVACNGLGMLIRATAQIPLIFWSDGVLEFESAVGSGSTSPLTPSLFSWGAGSYVQMAPAFQRMYLANGDLHNGSGTPAVTDGTNIDPASQRPVGEKWQAATVYAVGEVISPNTANGHTYQVTVGGTSAAAEPSWPTTDGATVVDGTVTWKERTLNAGNLLPSPGAPILTRVGGAGTFPVGRDVYIQISWVNAQGETLVSTSASIINTVLNDRVSVAEPAKPSWISGLGVSYAITNFKVYEADVATAAPAPAASAYRLVGSVATGASGSVDATAGGAVVPVANTARIAPVGNVCSGTRYVSVMFVNRFGDISGFGYSAIISVTTDASFQMFFGNIPIGPSNVVQRIITLGPAGQTSSGPFFSSPAAQVYNGVQMSSFVINDNTTTSITLNWLDDWLETNTQFTNNQRKIKLAPQADVQYIPSLKRLVYVGESGQQSLGRWSEPDNPECHYGDNGFMYIARDNGERLVTHRDAKNGLVVAFKERSAYAVKADNSAPVNWGADKLWDKVGPSGPRAVDVGREFIAFACESGGYIWPFTGDPECVTLEIADRWKQNNWDARQNISVTIDDVEKEVHFCVPYGQSTLPSKVFTMDFKRGTEAPIHFSSFSGKEVALPSARKWSINDIKANQMARVPRRVSVGTLNPVVYESNLLVGSSDEDGIINMVTPGTYNDNGQGIDASYDFASVGRGSGLVRFGGVEISAQGNGKMSLFALPYHGDAKPMGFVNLSVDNNRFYRKQFRGVARQWGLRVTNNSQPDAWFEIALVNMFVNPIWRSEAASANNV